MFTAPKRPAKGGVNPAQNRPTHLDLFSGILSAALQSPPKRLDFKPSALAKSTRTPLPSSRSTGRKSQIMATCEMFQPDDAIFSRADFPASRFPRPGSEKARTMTVSSGRQCLTLLRKTDQIGLLVKMLLTSSTWNSSLVSLIWNPLVTKSNRLLFRLVPLTPNTGVTASGLLPTPTKSEAEHPGRIASKKGSQKHLAVEMRMMPTPKSRDSKGVSQRGIYAPMDSIANFARLFPTPTRDDAGKSTLSDKARRRVIKHGSQQSLTTTLNGQLNPAFVEWLMGYQIGHTDLPDWATPSSRNLRKSSSRQSTK